jgi:hypothetical protein
MSDEKRQLRAFRRIMWIKSKGKKLSDIGKKSAISMTIQERRMNPLLRHKIAEAVGIPYNKFWHVRRKADASSRLHSRYHRKAA